jgi:pimeloyl-ACP methyl ester carboxylesterase
MSMNFVLVPGAGGDAHYWHLVTPLLREAGHRVVAPDLPAGDDAAGLGEYADAIVAAAGGEERIVLVAQSMGAFSAPMAVQRLDVERMVLVAPMIPAPGDTPGTWWSSTGQDVAARESAIAEGRDPYAPFDLHETFLHDVPQPVIEDLLARGERPESGRAFEDTWPLAAWPDLPTRVIAGRHDRLFPLSFIQAVSRERLRVEPEIVDSGHLPALSVPGALAARLTSPG